MSLVWGSNLPAAARATIPFTPCEYVGQVLTPLRPMSLLEVHGKRSFGMQLAWCHFAAVLGDSVAGIGRSKPDLEAYNSWQAEMKTKFRAVADLVANKIFG